MTYNDDGYDTYRYANYVTVSSSSIEYAAFQFVSDTVYYGIKRLVFFVTHQPQKVYQYM